MDMTPPIYLVQLVVMVVVTVALAQLVVCDPVERVGGDSSVEHSVVVEEMVAALTE